MELVRDLAHGVSYLGSAVIFLATANSLGPMAAPCLTAVRWLRSRASQWPSGCRWRDLTGGCGSWPTPWSWG